MNTMSAMTVMVGYLKSNPGTIWTNKEMADHTGYNVTTVSNTFHVLFKAGEVERLQGGVWRFIGVTTPAVSPSVTAPEPAPETDTKPSTVMVMDKVLDEKNWFEVKVSRVQHAGEYDYYRMVDRNGRTGIFVWDA